VILGKAVHVYNAIYLGKREKLLCVVLLYDCMIVIRILDGPCVL
jgi:hypothetical protein